MHRTKIVCTIGPASEEVNILKKMINAGMSVARLNFSHGSYEEHEKRINNIRQAAGDTSENVSMLLDTKGPEIRLGDLEREPVYLEEGSNIILTTEMVPGNEKIVSINYKQLPEDVILGNIILISDGLISLEVVKVREKEVECKVLNGGEITSRKGVNVPSVHVNLPALTDRDIEDINFGIKHNVDFFAVSFVRRAEDILNVQEILENGGSNADIIAKIENEEAVKNVEDIIKVSNGIMVARGDLGVEIPAERVPLIQKEIIKKCNQAGKPVITATQMLESMIDNPRPTRAEASDVANAILDGTDAVMLSAESAAGKYPVDSVQTMARIAKTAESGIDYEEILDRKGKILSHTVTDAIGYATCSTAHALEAAAIISSTESGYTPRIVSKYRPRAPIIAVTPNENVLRKLSINWGVNSVIVKKTEDTDSMISAAVDSSLKAGLINNGDLVVITAGVPVGVHGTTNLLKVHTIGDVLARGIGIGDQAVTGTLRVARSYKEAEDKIENGDILACPATNSDYIPSIKKAAAIITETGGLTSHAAIVGLEYGIPVLVGVEGATAKLPDGKVITVDGQRGLIYGGSARVM